ncbi:hypothetical protein C0581_04600 [Candidatus Parcubacteria bacterium]|nr:MAG: hypothetical protein C0581_04600 [Candidatus Parcubacteria bacterium]
MDGIGDVLKKAPQKKQNKNIHSDVHYLADTISSTFGEKNRFGMYLGIIKRIGVGRARQVFAEIKDSDIDNPGRLFVWKTSKKNMVIQPAEEASSSAEASADEKTL